MLYDNLVQNHDSKQRGFIVIINIPLIFLLITSEGKLPGHASSLSNIDKLHPTPIIAKKSSGFQLKSFNSTAIQLLNTGIIQLKYNTAIF